MSKKDTIERRFNTAGTISRRAESDPDSRQVEGYAALFGETADMGWFTEEIAPDAFDDIIGQDDVRALFNHDYNKVLARRAGEDSDTLALVIDKKGLFYKFDAPNSGPGNDLIESLDRRDISGSSFAFFTAQDAWQYADDENGLEKDHRTVLKISRLVDVGPVTFPAYPDTEVARRSLNTWEGEHPHQDTPENNPTAPGPTLRERIISMKRKFNP